MNAQIKRAGENGVTHVMVPAINLKQVVEQIQRSTVNKDGGRKKKVQSNGQQHCIDTQHR